VQYPIAIGHTPHWGGKWLYVKEMSYADLESFNELGGSISYYDQAVARNRELYFYK
jgi:hypothetical protein